VLRPERTAQRTSWDSFDALIEEAMQPAAAEIAEDPVALPLGATIAGDRFRILRRSWPGGTGLVYAAFDSERNVNVALKVLMSRDPGSLRLKREFRALEGIKHPNLLQLHELFAEHGRWFFTMDLIEGEHFDDWVRPGGTLDPNRLRSALSQLFSAVNAIHAAGKIHRDLKPSNVLLTARGRVAVLDFGLVADVLQAETSRRARVPSGTPAYMAPELLNGGAGSAASDLYAIGVMLFEALTGRLPFAGTAAEVRRAKLLEPPAFPDVPSEHVDTQDLFALCRALLARDPHARAEYAQLSAPLAAASRTRTPSDAAAASCSAPTLELVGRDAELKVLRSAYDAMRGGERVVLDISGESGVGKTALCEAFFRGLQAEGEALVLSGRCYECESVPFKGFDAIIDALTRYLERLPAARVAALLPRDMHALVELFPVLRRVDAQPNPGRSPQHTADARERQRRAFRALTELLRNICDGQPIVLHVDDMQWTDDDSIDLLHDLLAERNALPVLFILSRRDGLSDRGALTLPTRKLELAPLSLADATYFATWLLERRDPTKVGLAAAIAHESRGNPLFATELARFASGATASTSEPLTTSLSALLANSIASLSDASCTLLSTLALAGQPIALETALDASGAAYCDLDVLRGLQLVRTHVRNEHKLIECYHDRIREDVATRLPSSERQRVYRALTQALQARDPADPELLCRCLAASGDLPRAAYFALAAADRAAAMLAFEHAAMLYRKALELGLDTEVQVRDAWQNLGHVLESAGRGREAADAYQAAARRSEGYPRLDLQRRAAEQLLATGYVERGTALIQGVAAAVNLSCATSKPAAALQLAWNHSKLRLRGLGRRAPRTLRTELATLRLRTANTLVTGLIGYQPLQAADIASQYLMSALGAGDSLHLVRALGLNTMLSSTVAPHSAWTYRLLARMDEVQAVDSPESSGFSRVVHGVVAHNHERFRAARTELAGARKALAESAGVAWELDAVHIFDQASACACGDYADLVRDTPGLIDEAFRCGRLYAGAALSGVCGLPAWLTPDDPASYADRLTHARRCWPSPERPDWPDHLLLMGEVMLSIYVGRPETGLELLENRRAAHASSLSSKSSMIKLAFFARRGMCAASALHGPNRDRRDPRRSQWRRVLRECIDALQRVGGNRSRSIAQLLKTVLALEAGRVEEGVGGLRATLALHEQAESAMAAAATRQRLGRFIGGEEGRALRREGERFMRTQGVKNVDAMSELLCPGCSQ